MKPVRAELAQTIHDFVIGVKLRGPRVWTLGTRARRYRRQDAHVLQKAQVVVIRPNHLSDFPAGDAHRRRAGVGYLLSGRSNGPHRAHPFTPVRAAGRPDGGDLVPFCDLLRELNVVVWELRSLVPGTEAAKTRRGHKPLGAIPCGCPAGGRTAADAESHAPVLGGGERCVGAAGGNRTGV